MTVTLTIDSPSLRADAERNRVRILGAAREVFAESGIDAPIDEVAKLAGVGIATLYRRFPQRADLLAAAFEDKMSVYEDFVNTALADTDPWNGFSQFIRNMIEMQHADRGFRDVLTMTFPTAKRFEATRQRAYTGFTELIRRAKKSGALRPDFVQEDLIIILMANAGLVSAAGAMAVQVSSRLVTYLLQSFAAPSAGPLPPAPTDSEVMDVLTRWQRV